MHRPLDASWNSAWCPSNGDGQPNRMRASQPVWDTQEFVEQVLALAGLGPIECPSRCDTKVGFDVVGDSERLEAGAEVHEVFDT